MLSSPQPARDQRPFFAAKTHPSFFSLGGGPTFHKLTQMIDPIIAGPIHFLTGARLDLRLGRRALAALASPGNLSSVNVV